MGQLNRMQRYAISLMLKDKKTQTEIADAIGVNKSTISRELRRNGTDGKYHYTTAQELCDIRKERLKSPIKNRVGIEERPAEADGTRFGDWELDLIVGPGNKGAKLTLVERSLSFAIIRNLPCGKVPSEVAKVVVDALLPFKRCGAVKTITTDNGPEFAEHELVSKSLGVAVYFADPYSSWQKGLIENTNMLIRQYIPRDDNFSKLTNEQVAAIQYKINRRPRKKLGFRIPYQEFYLSLQT